MGFRHALVLGPVSFFIGMCVCSYSVWLCIFFDILGVEGREDKHGMWKYLCIPRVGLVGKWTLTPLLPGILFVCLTVDQRILWGEFTDTVREDGFQFYATFYNAPTAIKVRRRFFHLTLMRLLLTNE